MDGGVFGGGLLGEPGKVARVPLQDLVALVEEEGAGAAQFDHEADRIRRRVFETVEVGAKPVAPRGAGGVDDPVVDEAEQLPAGLEVGPGEGVLSVNDA